jgi:hypothetical protein
VTSTVDRSGQPRVPVISPPREGTSGINWRRSVGRDLKPYTSNTEPADSVTELSQIFLPTRSTRVLFPMRSFDVSIDVILPASL